MAAQAYPRNVVQLDAVGWPLLERVHVDLAVDLVDLRADRLRRVLDEIRLFRVERPLVHPHHVCVESPGHSGQVVGLHQHVAATDVDLVFEANRHRLTGERLVELAVIRVDRLDLRALARRQGYDLVALGDHARGDLSREAAVVEVRPDYVLDRVAEVVEVAIREDGDRLEILEHVGTVVPRGTVAARHDVVADQCAHGEELNVLEAERLAELHEVRADFFEYLFGILLEVHLVHADGQMRNAQKRSDVRMASRLLEHAVSRVDQNQCDVGRRGAGHHVPGVLNVTRGVSDDELALVGREVAVGHVDRDALLALRLEAIGQQRKIRLVALRSGADGCHLVLEDHARVVEDAPDQGRLAVVHGAHRHEAE